MLPSNVSLRRVFYFKSFIAPITRRRFPLQQPCKSGICRLVVRGAGKKMVRWQENTASKFNPDQCKKVSPSRARNSVENRQKRQSRSRQATEQKTNCNWSSQVAKWLYHANTTWLPNIDRCVLGIKSLNKKYSWWK